MRKLPVRVMVVAGVLMAVGSVCLHDPHVDTLCEGEEVDFSLAGHFSGSWERVDDPQWRIHFDETDRVRQTPRHEFCCAAEQLPLVLGGVNDTSSGCGSLVVWELLTAQIEPGAIELLYRDGIWYNFYAFRFELEGDDTLRFFYDRRRNEYPDRDFPNAPEIYRRACVSGCETDSDSEGNTESDSDTSSGNDTGSNEAGADTIETDGT